MRVEGPPEQSHPLVWILAAVVTFLVLLLLRRKPKAAFYGVIGAAVGWGVALFIYVPPYVNPALAHSLGDAFVIEMDSAIF